MRWERLLLESNRIDRSTNVCVCVCLMLQPRSGVERGPDLIRAAGLLHRLQELGEVTHHYLSHTKNWPQLFRIRSRQQKCVSAFICVTGQCFLTYVCLNFKHRVLNVAVALWELHLEIS